MEDTKRLVRSIHAYLNQEAPGQEEIAEELLKKAYKILAAQAIELEELEELRANKILIKELCRA